MIAFADQLSTAPEFRRVCKWCEEIQDGLGPVKPGELVTHGICLSCVSLNFPEIPPGQIQAFVDKFNGPLTTDH